MTSSYQAPSRDQPKPPAPTPLGPVLFAMTQESSHRAQTQLPATYLIPRGAGQRGWGPLHFRDFSIIRNIKVTPPNHHLPRPTSTQIQGRKLLASPSWRTWAQRRPPKFWANGRTPQLNSGTCPPSPEDLEGPPEWIRCLPPPGLCTCWSLCRAVPGPRPTQLALQAAVSAPTPPSQTCGP